MRNNLTHEAKRWEDDMEQDDTNVLAAVVLIGCLWGCVALIAAAWWFR